MVVKNTINPYVNTAIASITDHITDRTYINNLIKAIMLILSQSSIIYLSVYDR